MSATVIGNEVWMNGYRVASLDEGAPRSVLDEFTSMIDSGKAYPDWVEDRIRDWRMCD